MGQTPKKINNWDVAHFSGTFGGMTEFSNLDG
jgi:hypothetical protein